MLWTCNLVPVLPIAPPHACTINVLLHATSTVQFMFCVVSVVCQQWATEVGEL